MSDNTIAALGFSIVGLLYIGLGIPLLLGRVRPNSFYGCRTRKTLSDETIWYAVNRVGGRDLIIGGFAVLMTSVIVYTVGDALNSNVATILLLAVLVGSTFVMAINSLIAQSRF